MSANKKVQFLILSFLSLAFLAFFYGDLLLQPNSYLFGAESDGVKNYYTYAYHIKNNRSTTNFEGFNYPYGEHFYYTDCQPLISIALQKASKVFPSISNYSIGIINLLMLLSFYVGAVFIYLIFKKLKLPPLLSIFGAIGIMVLAPQIFRMNGHYALSYSCFIPISMYLIYQLYHANRSKKWVILLIINNLFWLLIHAYLGIIVMCLLLCFECITLLSQKVKKVDYNWKRGLSILSTIIIPISFFLLLAKFTDLHQNRDTTPYGFFEYYADFDTIFLPHHGQLRSLITPFLPPFTQTWEGWAYIGIGTIISLGLLFILSFRKSVQLKQFTFSNLENTYLKRLLIASIIVLLFSFGIPFQWGLESWLDYLSFLKQFRSIGRFAWVFYFAATITSIYFVYQLSLKVKSKVLSYIIQLLLPLLMIVEGKPYHDEVSYKASQCANYFDTKQLPSDITDGLNSISPSNFQAIIPLPFYSIGPENHERDGSNKIYEQSMVFAYHVKLPILAIHLARTSIVEGRNSLQLLSPTLYSKEIEKDIPSKKPFLIIKSLEEMEKDEHSLLSRSKLIFSSKQYELYQLEYDSLFQNTAELEIQKFLTNKQTLIKKGQYWLSDSTSFFKHIPRQKFRKNGQNVIHQLQNNELNIGQQYTASAWFFNGGDNFGQDQLNYLAFKMVETKQGNIIQEKAIEVMSSSTISNGWTRVEIEFTPKDLRSKIDFICLGNDPNDKNLIIEDFLLSKSSQDIYWFSKDSTVLNKNNQRLNY